MADQYTYNREGGEARAKMKYDASLAKRTVAAFSLPGDEVFSSVFPEAGKLRPSFAPDTCFDDDRLASCSVVCIWMPDATYCT